MDDFKNLLEQQMQKAKASSGPLQPDAKAQPRGGDGSKAAQEKSGEISSLPAASEKPEQARQRRGGVAEAAPGRNKQIVPASANLNRVTVNLFDADRRALAVIKEKLGTGGHDFTNRSDSIKVALRIASKAKREELVQAFEQVKAEDRRFKNVE